MDLQLRAIETEKQWTLVAREGLQFSLVLLQHSTHYQHVADHDVQQPAPSAVM